MTSIVGEPAVTRFPEARARELAGERRALLRDVRHRADAVVALLDARVWPHAELATLAGFVRSTVLRHASDEEVLFYPNDCHDGPFAELSADHARLYALTARLAGLDTGRCSLGELRSLVDELLVTLERHLAAEDEVFARLELGEVTSASDTDEHGDEPLAIRLDALPAQWAVQMCIERVLRLAPGRRAEIRASKPQQLRPVAGWLHDFDAARYVLAQRPGPDGAALLEVACRASDTW